ncbi:MAG: glycoside hydrolase family 57 protein [Candidatus Omnitrophota bacterium]
MNKVPTDVIFLWHMHQPCYKDPIKNLYVLPWVRLHAVKDYYGMAMVLDKFDKAKATFNFSGILLDQLRDYAENNASDYYCQLTLKDPAYLTRREREFIVNRFFSINFEKIIRPNKRYLQLYQKKVGGKGNFTSQEIMDLQAIFNLCWFHPYTIKRDKHLRSLIAKNCGYTQEDKEYVIRKQYDIIKKIIPLYGKLLRDRRIELSLTPYAHPIMPLICDSDITKEFSYLKKPRLRFSRPQDCRWHLDRSKEIFRDLFGCDIKGSWPSEGSVSEEVAEIYAAEGFRWIATDEGILFNSFTTEFVSYELIKNQRHIIYRPYNFKGVDIFFRDRNLSDAIGFIYQGWDDPVFAANDLLEHFKRTHYHASNFLRRRAISIIMDGENAWEYYKNSGVDFLEAVYAGLENNDILVCSTPSQFLRDNKTKKLERLFAGSWINSDFGVWVGSKENNNNWHILRRLRDLIERYAKDGESKEKVLKYFYILEGRDWNWWNTFEDTDGDFKKLPLLYVKKIYKMLGKTPPSHII